MVYYAHISADGQRRQTVAEHPEGTATLCWEFAADFDAGESGELAGLTHDHGKCTEGFQNCLLRGGPRVDHATAGALLCDKQNPFAAICVAGHHTGLPDFGNRKVDRPSDNNVLRKDEAWCGAVLSGTLRRKRRKASAAIAVRSPYQKQFTGVLLDTDALFLPGGRGLSGYRSVHERRPRLGRVR